MDVALPFFILGYHGCDAKLAEEVFAGKKQLKKSENKHDWLGKGTYFWEHNAQRAYDFAVQMRDNPHPSGQKIKDPAVVGAVIDLGFCLNLFDSTNIRLVKQAHEDFLKLFKGTEELIPKNTRGPDRVDRKLDCAVINHLHFMRETEGLQAFNSVRSPFPEGEDLYPTAGFKAATHVQITVHDPARIMGYFRPLDEKGKPRRFK